MLAIGPSESLSELNENFLKLTSSSKSEESAIFTSSSTQVRFALLSSDEIREWLLSQRSALGVEH